MSMSGDTIRELLKTLNGKKSVYNSFTLSGSLDSTSQKIKEPLHQAAGQ
jgi:hypothetical protein